MGTGECDSGWGELTGYGHHKRLEKVFVFDPECPNVSSLKIPSLRRMLVDVYPNWSKLFQSDDRGGKDDGTNRRGSNKGKSRSSSSPGTRKQNRLHYLFGSLIRALSSPENPVLFFMDDLQWADKASLDLVTHLVGGVAMDFQGLSSGSHVLFVGSYRDNEVDEGHALFKRLKRFESDKGIHVTNVSLRGISVDSLNEMISESLCLPRRLTRSLAEITHQKTSGYPLFATEFLKALVNDKMLNHSLLDGWEWDVDTIDLKSISDNVAELFTHKLRRLPVDVMMGLSVLSCFGCQVEKHTLNFVQTYDGKCSADIMEAVRVGERECLIDRAGEIFAFSHDLIQKAAFDLIPPNELVSLLQQLAAALITGATAEGEIDSVIFVAVDIINRIGNKAITNTNDRHLFATLNLKAGKKSLAVPDFASASRYLESGINLLNEEYWTHQYELSRGLFEESALAHYSEGRFDRVATCVHEVLRNGRCLEDKFKSHLIVMKVLSISSVPQAIAKGTMLLEHLGEPIVPVADYNMARSQIMGLKLSLSGDRKKQFLSAAIMTDPKKLQAMKIMSLLVVFYHQQKSILCPLVSCHMIKTSMEYGQCEDSVFAAAAFASALVNVLHEIDEGCSWGRIALSLIKDYDSNHLIPCIHGSVYGIVLFWKDPLQSTLDPLLEGCRVGFSNGNIEFAVINTIYYVARSFNVGKKLHTLQSEIEAFAKQHVSYISCFETYAFTFKIIYFHSNFLVHLF